MSSFTEKLDEESLKFFNDLCQQPFSRQGVAFLNAYWDEIGDQADFVYSVAWEVIQYADMHCKGVSLIHLYDEGNDLDFNIGLYFYEKLCKYVEDHKEWADEKWKLSQPQMLTAIVRKKELREKVDVNFDGRVSLLEYLLYQYREFANPADFIIRSMQTEEEHPEITKARLALEEVTKAMKAYEKKKTELEAAAQLSGVKGLRAKHELAQLDASPLKEKLNASLIHAEAMVRIATRKFGTPGMKVADPKDGSKPKRKSSPTAGAIWWMNRDLEEKKRRYGNHRACKKSGAAMAAESRKQSE